MATVWPRIIIFRDASGKYRWNLRTRNGEKVATSGESFDSKLNARSAAELVRLIASSAVIIDAEAEAAGRLFAKLALSK